MVIRQFKEEDTPQVIELLKASLGESLLPKTTAYFTWKHLDNPFGRSFILVATEGDKVIGLRAFMRWTWARNGEELQAVRAVDTATHPDHQGKGIFTKLTMAMVEQCKSENISIVFNTPNEKSMPGYLKMGWLKADKLPVRIAFVQPLKMVSSMLSGPIGEANVPNEFSLDAIFQKSDFASLVERSRSQSDDFRTPHTEASLRWRYRDVPIASYHALSIGAGRLEAVIFFRLKPGRLGREFRITDALVDGDCSRQAIFEAIKRAALKCDAHFVSISQKLMSSLLGAFAVRAKVGPIVTIRPLATNRPDDFVHFSHWSPSLGDLELF
jgi:GNAT superfamily N-acetyltransferase